MLDYKLIGRIPDSIRLTRNDQPVEAGRARLGDLRVRGRSLWVADSACIASVPPLPIRIADGRYAVYAYQWQHAGEAINVCAVVIFRPQQFAFTRRLPIHTKIRPDLTEGIVVDTAEIAIRSDDSVKMQSGLGDGYYPIFANYNFGVVPQSVVVDFKIWEMDRQVMLRPGQEMDEYGIVRFDESDDSEAGDDQAAFPPR